jgi:hypothetical protein
MAPSRDVLNRSEHKLSLLTKLKIWGPGDGHECFRAKLPSINEYT